MNEFIASLVLAFVQGISEWFPISSSGHLVMFSYFLGFVNTIEFDVALHFGTLMAVFVYFGREITDIIEDIFRGSWKSENAKIGWMILVSAIPAAFAGYFLRSVFELAFGSIGIVAIGFGITSISLFIASLNLGKKRKDMGYRDSFLIGIAQAFAIFPGVSRSGSTISTGLILGLNEEKAVKFSFLMSIPVIFGAGLLELGARKLDASYLLPTFVAFIVGLLTIHLLLKIVINSRKNLRWFALYCLALAIGLGIYLLLDF